jgi:hypothetical protein
MPSVHFSLVILEMGSCELFAQAGFLISTSHITRITGMSLWHPATKHLFQQNLVSKPLILLQNHTLNLKYQFFLLCIIAEKASPHPATVTPGKMMLWTDCGVLGHFLYKCQRGKNSKNFKMLLPLHITDIVIRSSL